MHPMLTFILLITSTLNYFGFGDSTTNEYSVNVTVVAPNVIYIYDEIFGKNDELFKFYVQIKLHNIDNYIFKFRIEEDKKLLTNKNDVIYNDLNQLKVQFVLEMPTESKIYEVKGDIMRNESNTPKKGIFLFTHNISFIKLRTPTSENILLDRISCRSKKLHNLLLMYYNKFNSNFYANIYAEYSNRKMITIYNSEKESYKMFGPFGDKDGKLPYMLYPIEIAKFLCGNDVRPRLKSLFLSGMPDDTTVDITIYYDAYPISKNTSDKSFYLKMMFKGYRDDMYKNVDKDDFHLKEYFNSETININLEIFLNYYSYFTHNYFSTSLIFVSIILIFYQTIVLFYV
uniref:Uncharacterized protein n=1 Tax=Strongyloides venezuelensis TaxID=75913 RepID=A0A0K0F7P5_STRVS